MVHGFPPGGPTDLVARLVADGLSRRLGQRLVVEGRPGASGTTAIAESVPGYVVTGWQGLVAPAGLPVAIRDRLNAAVVATLKEWAVVERLQALGNEPHPSTPEEFRARMVADIAKWTAVVDNSNFERI